MSRISFDLRLAKNKSNKSGQAAASPRGKEQHQQNHPQSSKTVSAITTALMWPHQQQSHINISFDTRHLQYFHTNVLK